MFPIHGTFTSVTTIFSIRGAQKPYRISFLRMTGPRPLGIRFSEPPAKSSEGGNRSEERHHVVMNYRNFVKPENQIVSTESGLAATTTSSSGWPVGGEMFLLTAHFIERF